MDDGIVQTLENLIYKKIILYNDLLHLLRKERASLIKIDLDDLWHISKEKEDICSKISAIRREIISYIDPEMTPEDFLASRILALIPRASRSGFQKSYVNLINLKNEIEAMRKENMDLINDSLLFLDEMVSIITGDNQDKMLYDGGGHISKSGTQMLFSREV